MSKRLNFAILTFMVKAYELTIILKPNLKKEKINSILNKIKKIIKENKGKIEKEEEPQEKQFAYPIDKFEKGIYLFLNFKAQPKLGALLEKMFKLEENILRYLLIKGK